MSKHFYFGTTVVFLVVMYLTGAFEADAWSILLTGFAFAFVMLGMVLNELCERRETAEAFERAMCRRMENIEFDLQVIRDCKCHDLATQGCCLIQTMEAMDKVIEGLKKEQKPPIKKQEVCKSEV